MSQTAISSRKLFVLDTNVLVHDPSALFRFQEHDVFLPMMVLEELDAVKKGVSEVARNVRLSDHLPLICDFVVQPPARPASA